MLCFLKNCDYFSLSLLIMVMYLIKITCLHGPWFIISYYFNVCFAFSRISFIFNLYLLQGVYAVRSAVDGNRVYTSCSRQVVRRLVALGFTNQVLLKSFQQDPAYEIPSTVFLQDMTEVFISPQGFHQNLDSCYN